VKIKQPTLLLDKEKCLANIGMMVEKAKLNNLKFRPHFKTHQSAKIGKCFKDFGVNAITVSSVQMAEYFAQNDWKDITIAFPINLLEIEKIDLLAQKIELNILACNIESINFLKTKLKYSVGVFIKIDTGYHRAGILPENTEEINSLIDVISENSLLKFKGFLAHDGHTYNAKTKQEIIAIRSQSNANLRLLKKNFISDFPELIISVGDTPSCSIADDFDGIDEIRPGNFVFYDLMQCQLGSCKIENIAVVLACPVVDKRIDRNEIIIYGGGTHLSTESIVNIQNQQIFGAPILISQKGWSKPLENSYVSSLSQEHGIVKLNAQIIDEINVGDVIGIIPVHSCLTVNLMKELVEISELENNI